MRRDILAAFIVLLIFFAIASFAQAEDISSLIPADTTCCVLFRSPNDLIVKTSDLLNELAIPGLPPVNPLFMLLSGMLKIELSSIVGMENLGFDSKRSGAVFWSDPTFQNTLIAIHVKEKSGVGKWLNGRFGTLTSVEYAGMSYFKSYAGVFVFLEDVMLFAQDEADAKLCIDVHRGEKPSIFSIPDGASSLSMEDRDVAGYVSLKNLMSVFAPLVKMKLGDLKTDLVNNLMDDADGQSGAMASALLLATEIDLGIWAIEQMQSLGLAFAFDKQKVRLDIDVSFQDGSVIQGLLPAKPRKLELLGLLPGDASMAGSVSMDKAGVERFAAAILDQLIISKAVDAQEQKKETLKAMESFLDLIGGEVAYVNDVMPTAATGALEPLTAAFVIPLGQSVTCVMDVPDEAAVQDYFGDFASKMKPFYDIFSVLGATDKTNPFAGLERRDAEKHNGVHIESIYVPNYPVAPMRSRADLPEIGLRYALKSGKLVVSIGRNAENIKKTLDVVDGKTISFADAIGFEEASAGLPAEINLVHYLSPVGYFKSLMRLAIQEGMPMSTPEMQIIEAIEDGIAVGNSTVFRDAKIEKKLHFSVDEARKLISAYVKLIEASRAGDGARSQMDEYRRAGELDKMLELAGEMVETNLNGLGIMQIELIEAFFEYGRQDELRDFFLEHIEKKPDNPLLYRILGEIHNRSGNKADAIEMYKKAIELDKGDVGAYSCLGVLYAAQGMLQESISAYEKALEFHPEATHLFAGLASSYMSAGQREKVLELVEQIKRKAGNSARDATHHDVLGDLYGVLDESSKAIESYKKAVALQPKNGHFEYKLERAYREAEKYELADELRVKRESTHAQSKQREVMKALENISLQMLDGSTVKLSAFKGKATILNFWATWSPLCAKEMAVLEELYQAYDGRLVVVGISINTDGIDVVKSYAEKLGITYPIAIATKEMLDEYAGPLGEPIKMIPTTVAIDWVRYIQDMYAGPQSKGFLETVCGRMIGPKPVAEE